MNNRFPITALNPQQGEGLTQIYEKICESVARLVQDGSPTHRRGASTQITVDPAATFATSNVVATFPVAILTSPGTAVKLSDYQLIDLSGQAANYTVYITNVASGQTVGATFAPTSAFWKGLQAEFTTTVATATVSRATGVIGATASGTPTDSNLYVTIVISGATSLAANANNGLVLNLGVE